MALFTGSKFGFGKAAGGGGSAGGFQATGGNQSGPGGAGTALEPGNGYKYHIFTSPGNFVIASGSGAVEYVIVAGGGGGADNGPGNLGAGGGGAGGYLEGTSSLLSASTNPVVIGPDVAKETEGVDSTALGQTAYGGGKGVTHVDGTPGGSGGGAAYADSGGYGLNPSTPSPIITADFPGESHPYALTQGYPGGPGAPSPGGTCPGAGGGGAGGAGQETYPGNVLNDGSGGGIGRAAFSGDTGIPPSYGTPGPSAGRWFAGGGGGGAPPAAPPSSATGGAGGGGRGSGINGTSVAGTTNTGGGGGAGAYAAPTNNGAGGGAGIVIIRY